MPHLDMMGTSLEHNFTLVSTLFRVVINEESRPGHTASNRT